MKQNKILMNTIIALAFLSFAFCILSGCNSANGQKDESLVTEEKAVRQCIEHYMELARNENKVGVKALLSMTPPQYWTSVSNEEAKLAPQTSATNIQAESVTHSFGPLDDLSYKSLTGLTFLAAGKYSATDNQIGPIRVTGNFAKALVILDFRRDPVFKSDYLLQKLDGRWTIFRIDSHSPKKTFPYLGPSPVEEQTKE